MPGLRAEAWGHRPTTWRSRGRQFQHVTFPPELADAIERIAARNNATVADTVRTLVGIGVYVLDPAAATRDATAR